MFRNVAGNLDNKQRGIDSLEPQEGVVMRTRKGELVGITIIGLRNHLS
jgi:hypothetical protein